MKKTLALALSIVLFLLLFSGIAQAEDAPKFVTVEEWLEAKGECGDCLVLLKIQEVLNPVLAVGADETGTVNLYSGGPDSIIIEFGSPDLMLTGYWMVIANPRYNEYEGTIEMADWTLLRLVPNMG